MGRLPLYKPLRVDECAVSVHEGLRERHFPVEPFYNEDEKVEIAIYEELIERIGECVRNILEFMFPNGIMASPKALGFARKKFFKRPYNGKCEPENLTKAMIAAAVPDVFVHTYNFNPCFFVNLIAIVRDEIMHAFYQSRADELKRAFLEYAESTRPQQGWDLGTFEDNCCPAPPLSALRKIGINYPEAWFLDHIFPDLPEAWQKARSPELIFPGAFATLPQDLTVVAEHIANNGWLIPKDDEENKDSEENKIAAKPIKTAKPAEPAKILAPQPIPEKREKKKKKSEGPSRNLLVAYFKEVNRHPLLSREEEEELIARFLETGDPAIRERLINANLRIVVKIAKHFLLPGMDLMDLIQEGNLGLQRAVDKFDPNRGTRLVSYATWWIKAFIKTYIMKNRFIASGRVTTQGRRAVFYNLSRAEYVLRKKLGRLATDEELAKEIDGMTSAKVTTKDVHSVRSAGRGHLYLDTPIGDGEDGQAARHLDRLESKGPSPEQAFEEGSVMRFKKAALHEAMADLTKKEQTVIRIRHLGIESRTLREAGEAIGLSRERARQLEASALQKLRKAMLKSREELGEEGL